MIKAKFQYFYSAKCSLCKGCKFWIELFVPFSRNELKNCSHSKQGRFFCFVDGTEINKTANNFRDFATFTKVFCTVLGGYFELLDGGSIKNIFQSIANGTYSFVRELSQITFAFFDHVPTYRCLHFYCSKTTILLTTFLLTHP